MKIRHPVCILAWLAIVDAGHSANFNDPNADRDALPTVPAGFEVSFFAREPLVRQPCSMTFDAKGRLCVGMGPQYRNPKPNTPGDSVVLVLDDNGDGKADRTKTFATGFNAIQGLAWHGRDLWVANAPDLTVVRDLDGDDEADEYVRVFTDLGNLEHGLHGLNWAPDGKLYMSKGNSKGLTQPGRIAPKAFRDLWGVNAAIGSPDFPEPRTFTKGAYQKAYHDPEDDWGREGGVLRCDDGGRNLDPPLHRGVFFINDWLRKTTFVWRPRWDGALLRSVGDWEPFVQGGPSLFRPTDLEVGPDGALWILGWSSGYGAEYKDGQMTSEGRVFRVVSKSSPPARWQTLKRSKPIAQWTVAQLVEDFDGPLPVWRSDAQDELVRRGASVKTELLTTLATRGLNEARETWTAWTLGRMTPQDRIIDEWFETKLADSAGTLNLRVQSLRILAHRVRQWGVGRELPASAVNVVYSAEPRLRFEAAQAIGQARQHSALPALLEWLAAEGDATTFYAAWQTLRGLQGAQAIKPLLTDARNGVRKAALLALLEAHSLQETEVRPLASDRDSGVREVAALWIRKASGGGEAAVVRGRPLDALGSDTTPPIVRVGLARNIKARSGARYTLAPAGLRAGAKPYTDRNYDLKQVPAALVGLDFIQTANNDDGSRGDGWLGFEALMPVRVHVAFDARAAAVPSWLREHFQQSTQSIRADHWTFHLYTRQFPAGRIELGGNTDDGQDGGKGNYLVVLEPLPLSTPTTPSATEPALALLNQGDRARGEWLFHARGGVGCFNCNRLDEHGNGFGPDLAALGDRATAWHIVQSMLEPNAVITEGFNLQNVETADVEYSGILIEESGLSLTLGLATGQRQVIPKSEITSRKTAATSAMPAYDTVLTPPCVADLAAYLLAQKSGAPSIVRTDSSAPSTKPSDAGRFESLVTPPVWPKGDGFRFSESANRLVIAHSSQPLAEFVFRDEKILRPYFANVHAPGGLKTTRNHPPIPGVDATDHDTMHPGIWLAFGEIGGADFWRNKGRIVHGRFSQPPGLENGALRFTTESVLLRADGEKLASLTSRFALMEKRGAWHITWESAFTPVSDGFYFGDQEEMGLGVRVATAITEKNGGVITSSAGLKTAKNTWGQPAAWCDYSGVINGKHVGVMIVPDPANPQPSWWHNRDYGAFVSNPFGRQAMKQGTLSRIEVKKGDIYRLNHTIILHASPDAKAPELPGFLK